MSHEQSDNAMRAYTGELPAPPVEREPPASPEPGPEDPRENTPVKDPPANPNQPNKRIAARLLRGITRTEPLEQEIA
jgi:hypothetical protein